MQTQDQAVDHCSAEPTMTPTPPSTTPSSSGQSPDAHFRVVRKRNRIPLSCAPCRHRKLKCNRGHPCDNCTKRGDTNSCTYATSNLRKKTNAVNANINTSPDEMQTRIDRLEGLVLSLMTNGSNSAGPTAAAAAIANTASVPRDSISGSSTGRTQDMDGDEMVDRDMEGQEMDDPEVEKMVKSIGYMKMDSSGKHIFASEAHWYSILAEISEVKNFFAEHKKQYDEQYSKIKSGNDVYGRATKGFLFKSEQPISHEEILTSFPPKSTTDTLISRFFTNYNYDPTLLIVHGPTFQKQYDQHWNTPNETPVIWLGMAYAMMVIAIQSYHNAGDEPPEYRGQSHDMLRDYKKLTIQCLMLTDLLQATSFTIETLLLYLIGEVGASADAEPGILIGISVIVRLAMRQGLHRDSKHYPQISVFEGEMRRRVWTVIKQADILFSMQAGLPPMVRPNIENVDLPRNIYDDELSEDMKVLPPSRSMKEVTPMCFVIYKGGLLRLLSEIVEEVQTLNMPSYEQVMKLDGRLREFQSNIPPAYKMRSLQDAGRDPAPLILQRYNADLLFLKCACVLHRKFAFTCPQATHNYNRFAYSRRVCLDSALEVLRHQVTLHTQTRPGGRLHDVNCGASSLISHIFLLAAMIVCLELYRFAEAERLSHLPTFGEPIETLHERRTIMIGALERSLEIWASRKDESMEAFKAAGMLTAMLMKVQSQDNGGQQPAQHPPPRAQPQSTLNQPIPFYTKLATSQTSPSNTLSLPSVAEDDMSHGPEHSAAMTLGMLSTGALTPNSAAANIFSVAPPTSGGVVSSSSSAFDSGASAGSPSQRQGTGTGSAHSPASNAGSSSVTPGSSLGGSVIFGSSTGAGPGKGISVIAGANGVVGNAASGGETASGSFSPFPGAFGGVGMAGGAGGAMGGGLGGMDFGFSNIDWDAWDSYIQTASFSDPSNGLGLGNTASSSPPTGNGPAVDVAPLWPLNMDPLLSNQTPVQASGNGNSNGGAAGVQSGQRQQRSGSGAFMAAGVEWKG